MVKHYDAIPFVSSDLNHDMETVWDMLITPDPLKRGHRGDKKHGYPRELELSAFDDRSHKLWVAVFLLFLVWWFVQLASYITRTRLAHATPERRADMKVDLATRLMNATKVGRDAFLLLFSAVLMTTAVGPTAASVVLSYVYLLFAVFWMLSAVFVLSPILNAIFGVCALPLLIAVFSIAFHHT